MCVRRIPDSFLRTSIREKGVLETSEQNRGDWFNKGHLRWRIPEFLELYNLHAQLHTTAGRPSGSGIGKKMNYPVDFLPHVYAGQNTSDFNKLHGVCVSSWIRDSTSGGKITGTWQEMKISVSRRRRRSRRRSCLWLQNPLPGHSQQYSWSGEKRRPIIPL